MAGQNDLVILAESANALHFLQLRRLPPQRQRRRRRRATRRSGGAGGAYIGRPSPPPARAYGELLVRDVRECFAIENASAPTRGHTDTVPKPPSKTAPAPSNSASPSLVQRHGPRSAAPLPLIRHKTETFLSHYTRLHMHTMYVHCIA